MAFLGIDLNSTVAAALAGAGSLADAEVPKLAAAVSGALEDVLSQALKDAQTIEQPLLDRADHLLAIVEPAIGQLKDTLTEAAALLESLKGGVTIKIGKDS